MAELYGKWEKTEEGNNPKMVIRLPRLKGDLWALGLLTEYQATPRQKLKAQRQEVSYITGYASGLEIGSVLQGQGKMISD